MQKRTIEILKNFANIDSKILFREGNDLRIRNATNSITAIATLPDEFHREFAIFDLNEFLATYSLFTVPSIDYKDRFMLINDEGGTQVKYYYAASSTVLPTPKGKVKLPDTQLSFTISKASLENTSKAASVMKLKEMVISKESVKVLNSNGAGNEYTCRLDDIQVYDDEFDSVTIAFEDLVLIPDTYSVTVTERGALFTAASGDVEYIVLYKIV